MFQLSLDFLGYRGGPAKTPRLEEPSALWVWKHGIRVHLVRHPRARRYLLRLQRDGVARLVIPRRGSRAEAVRFLERSEAWLLKQVGKAKNRDSSKLPWTDGTRFLFRGEEVVLRIERAEGRIQISFANEHLSLPNELPDYREVVLEHLRQIAERELPPRTRELALLQGIAISRVTVRAQKTRWGSCSARGTISLNWRLIHAPAGVVDYLIIHELMHRRQMNHSAKYWKLVADACPNYRTAEKWLQKTRIETV